MTSNASAGRSITFAWEVQSQNIANNTTTIYWQLTGSGSAGGWIESGAFKATLDGAVIYSSSTRIHLYNGTLIGEGTYTFTHDSQGNKSFVAYIEAGVHSYAVSVSATSSWSLPQIARLATINSFDKGADLASQMTVKFTPQATNFYYKLRLSIPNVVAIVTTNLGQKGNSQQTINYTFSNSQLTNTIYPRANANSDTIQIGAVIETYQDSGYTTKLGESSELIRNIALPSTIKPTISAVTLSDNTTAYSTIGSYVQGISKLNYSITAAGIYNSTITNYTITASGITYASSSASSGVTNVINQSGSLTITITAKDSRNRTVSTTRTISVLAYSKPQITSFICSRNPSNLSQVIAQMKGSITSLNNQNTHTFTLAYASHGSSSFTTIQTYNSLTLDTSKTITLTENDEYDFKITASDRFSSVSKVYVVTQAFRLINFGDDGESICLGGFAEREGFENKMDTYLKGGVFKWNETNEVYESIIPKTLYSNSSGTTGNITLSENASNFTELEIFYNFVRSPDASDITSYNYSKSIKLLADAEKFVITDMIFQNDRNWLKGGTTQYSISGKNITVDFTGAWAIGTGNYAKTSGNTIKITKILGR